MKIDEISKVIRDFLNSALGGDAKVVKITKDKDGWLGEAEIYEDSSFIKSLGLNTRVRDRNIYEVKLTNKLEVVSYEQKKE